MLANSLTMKISQIPTARLLLGLVAPLLLSKLAGAQTSAISVDRVNYFSQTASSTVTPQAEPFTLNFHIRGGTTDMSNWGPAFYIPGSGGTPQSGSNGATNTGTLNFSATPNNGGSFMFMHDFATNAALEAFYPIAPTDGGAYGVKFLGSAPPTPALFDDGLVFAAGTTYPSVTPQITSANNGAVWSGTTLRINPTGITTLTFNTFPEYSSTTYGSFIAVGIYSNTNGVVDEASTESYYLPLGDSSVPPVVPVNQPAVTQLSIDGSWLTPGVTYTMELQYAILSGQPEEANLNGIEFQGLATYRTLTTINLTVSKAAKADFDGDGSSDLIWQHPYYQTAAVWMMDGTSYKSHAIFDGLPPGSVVGSGDFNGDGKTDLVLQNQSTNNVEVCMMNGSTVLSHVVVADGIPEWKIVGTGDFNGDGKIDLIWEHPYYSITAVWLMDGTRLISSAVINDGGMQGWRVVGSGDFNSDGKSDLIWQHSTYGIIGVWLLDGTSLISTAAIGTEPNQYVGGSGDFNHDGKSDLILQNPTTGDVTVWLMDGLNTTSSVLVTSVQGWEIVNK